MPFKRRKLVEAVLFSMSYGTSHQADPGPLRLWPCLPSVGTGATAVAESHRSRGLVCDWMGGRGRGGGGGGLPPCVPEGRRVKNTQNHPPLKTLSFFCSQENNGVVLPGVQPYRMSLVWPPLGWVSKSPLKATESVWAHRGTAGWGKGKKIPIKPRWFVTLLPWKLH